MGSLLLSAVAGSTTVGQGLFIRTNDSLLFEWGWSDDAARERGVPVMHGIFWEALEWCRSDGLPYLDLGGFWEQRGHEDPINRFKLGFGKIRSPVCPEYEAILSRPRYLVLSLRNLLFS